MIVGKFEDATVFCNNKLINKSIDPEEFKKPYHDVTFGGNSYRFVNPTNLSQETINTLKQTKDTFVFSGDLSDMLITVSKKGINAQHVPEINSYEPA